MPTLTLNSASPDRTRVRQVTRSTEAGQPDAPQTGDEHEHPHEATRAQ